MDLDVHNVILPVGTQVELALAFQGKAWQLKAVVVHHNPVGVRVRFLEAQPELSSNLIPAKPMMPPSQRRVNPPSVGESPVGMSA